jgi:hypothetical protein
MRFLQEEDARRALEEILGDEPGWAGTFYVKPGELDERARFSRISARQVRAGGPHKSSGLRRS